MAVNLAKHYFTVGEYERMGESGIFAPEARVELIEGEIVEMSPIGSRHAACVEFVAETLTVQLHGRAIVRIQNPIVLDDFSEPQPDVAILQLRADRYRESHPRPHEVLLVIEVSDSTYSLDRNVKIPLYARAGIAEALIFNLHEDRLEYYSQPKSGVYQMQSILRPGEKFQSAIVPNVMFEVATILG
ncbi:MAG TPA: Uma2 family endonuclease [Pyrinomonadaceae bacterium]|nr:Uma2 family endonuclease [Pyrinomonadaceae bacterium]